MVPTFVLNCLLGPVAARSRLARRKPVLFRELLRRFRTAGLIRNRLEGHDLIPKPNEGLGLQNLSEQVSEIIRGLDPFHLHDLGVAQRQHPLLPTVDMSQLGALNLILPEGKAGRVMAAGAYLAPLYERDKARVFVAHTN